MPTREEIRIENTRRLARYNREWAFNLYWGFRLPPVLLLLHEDGIDRPYVPSPRAGEPQPDQTENPVGPGPDIHHTHAVVEPDYHAPGDIIQTRDGRTFVMVELPHTDGGMEKRWVQV